MRKGAHLAQPEPRQKPAPRCAEMASSIGPAWLAGSRGGTSTFTMPSPSSRVAATRRPNNVHKSAPNHFGAECARPFILAGCAEQPGRAGEGRLRTPEHHGLPHGPEASWSPAACTKRAQPTSPLFRPQTYRGSWRDERINDTPPSTIQHARNCCRPNAILTSSSMAGYLPNSTIRLRRGHVSLTMNPESMSNGKPHVIRLAREEVYDQVWNTLMRLLARSYGISDAGLAKVRKRHKIPRPSLSTGPRNKSAKRLEGHGCPPSTTPCSKGVEFMACPGRDTSKPQPFLRPANCRLGRGGNREANRCRRTLP